MDYCQNDVVFLLNATIQHKKKLGPPAKSSIYWNYEAYFLKVQIIIDNGGSRCGLDRRQHTIKGYAPERRLDMERRSGLDRRKALRPRDGIAIERRDIFREYSNIG